MPFRFGTRRSLGSGIGDVIAVLRPQDVFATSLYTGTGAAQTKALLFSPDFNWDKSRNNAFNHGLQDKLRGNGTYLASNTTAAEATGGIGQLTSNGFVTEAYGSGDNRVNWSFRRAAKFFDVVTYTGDGTSGRQISHGLGIAPGIIIVKRRNVSTDSYWSTYHKGLPTPSTDILFLEQTRAKLTVSSVFGAMPSDTTFTVGTDMTVNKAGDTYVAYLFAHDPDTTNGVIQCGSGNTTLPWSTQWVLYKDAGAVSDWRIQDAARGFTPAGSAPSLAPNLSAAEASNGALTVSGGVLTFSGLTTPVWCAIRAPT